MWNVRLFTYATVRDGNGDWRFANSGGAWLFNDTDISCNPQII